MSSHHALSIRSLVALFILAVASTAFGKSEFPSDWFWGDPDQRKQQDELLGQPAPKLDLSHWINGDVSAEDMKGKVVVVDFWATWCGPCIAAIPKNNAIHEKYKDKGVLVIGVCGSRNGQEKMGDVVKDKGIAYPTARDAEQASAKAWQVMWWPTYGVIDRKGNLRALGLKPTHVEHVVKNLLEEPATASAGAAAEATVRSAAADAIKSEWLEGKRDRFTSIEGKPAPELKVEGWKNSKTVTLADFKGKVVMLDFWATWCGPCIAAIPHTNELMEKYQDQGLVIIGVCNTRGAEKMAATAKDKGIKYPIAADVDGKTDEAYKVDSYPDYYFIDRAGNLRIADCKNGNVEDAIKSLLGEPAGTAAAR
jgi:thiol-disulfide isomerase/thioredoxin